MPYNIPNASTAANVDLAEPDTGDFRALGYQNTGVISGGAVGQSGTPSMTVQVTAAQIIISGTPYSKSAGPVTLDAAGANPRFDLIGWEQGTTAAIFKKGAESATNPVYPGFNPVTFCMTAAVYVGSGVITITDPYIVQKQVAPPTTFQRIYATDIDVAQAYSTPAKINSFKTLADGTISWVTSLLRRTADQAMEWATSLTIKQNSAADRALVLKAAVGTIGDSNIFEVLPDGSAVPVMSVDTIGRLLARNFRHGSGSPEGVLAASKGTVYLNDLAADADTALYVKITDTVSTGWVPLAGSGTVIPTMPTGTVINWPGTVATVPTGWLNCNGSEQATASYGALATFCGTRFGTASAGNFRLPDYRGRTPIGVDGTLTTLAGQNVGQSSVTLSISQIPAHKHTVTETAHSHPPAGLRYPYYRPFSYNPTYALPRNLGEHHNVGAGIQLEAAGQAKGAKANVTLANTGGGQPVSLLQPSQSTLFLIKT